MGVVLPLTRFLSSTLPFDVNIVEILQIKSETESNQPTYSDSPPKIAILERIPECTLKGTSGMAECCAM